ncbi:hypothetical protein [Okeania sp. SIO2B3]|uniref:hypothetical protein n=1 Tax=Okeania sp. SIO2B3 TaxID=2607784 RepID=UPI0013C1FF3C|nr:hypothetical protein [Okeania sp. SIO2B3]NET40679.1 hypothetical protein [Okeania sp. SIO2B3]
MLGLFLTRSLFPLEEGRRKKEDGRSKKAEARRQKAEDRRQKAEVRSEGLKKSMEIVFYIEEGRRLINEERNFCF